MANALGVEVSNYAKIEKKGNKLTLERIEQFANALKVPVIEILDSRYAVQLNKRIQDLEEENNDFKNDLKLYEPIMAMVEFMRSRPSQMEEQA